MEPKTTSNSNRLRRLVSNQAPSRASWEEKELGHNHLLQAMGNDASSNRTPGTVVVCNAMSGNDSQVSSKKFSGNDKTPRLLYPGIGCEVIQKTQANFRLKSATWIGMLPEPTDVDQR